MTGPVTTEALVEKLARDLAREGGWNDPDAPWTENQVIIARGGAGQPVWRDFVDDARSLLGRETFTTLLAALQQVTAERDEAWDKLWSACLDALVAQDQSAENDERARKAEASLATATSELARLRAEGEDLRAYAKKVGTTLVRLTCDGSEFYTRAGEDFRVDADACDAWVRRSRQSKHDMIVRLTKEISALRAEGEALRAALKVFAAMSAMDPPESVPLNEWLPAITGARAVLNDRSALARAATAREG